MRQAIEHGKDAVKQIIVIGNISGDRVFLLCKYCDKLLCHHVNTRCLFLFTSYTPDYTFGLYVSPSQYHANSELIRIGYVTISSRVNSDLWIGINYPNPDISETCQWLYYLNEIGYPITE